MGWTVAGVGAGNWGRAATANGSQSEMNGPEMGLNGDRLPELRRQNTPKTGSLIKKAFLPTWHRIPTFL